MSLKRTEREFPYIADLQKIVFLDSLQLTLYVAASLLKKYASSHPRRHMRAAVRKCRESGCAKRIGPPTKAVTPRHA